MPGEREVLQYIDDHQDELFACLSSLIRINTENFMQYGNEKACAEVMCQLYNELGLETEVYFPDEYVKNHKAYMPGRGTDKRPNVSGVFRGVQGNKSMMIAAHMDTVLIGNKEDWTVDPLGGEIKDGRIYGRGGVDNKFGLAAGYFIIKALQSCGIKLKQNVVLTAYCDEEGGGGNGSLAACIKYPCDVYLNTDSGDSKIWIASVGGQAIEAKVHAKETQDSAVPVLNGMNLIVKELCEFGVKLQEQLHKNVFFKDSDIERSAMRITEFNCGGNGFNVAHGRVQCSFYTDSSEKEVWDDLHKMERQITEELNKMGLIFEGFHPVSRFFDYAYISKDNPVVDLMADCAEEIYGRRPKKTGACLSDLFLYMLYGSPNSFGFGIMRNFNLYGGAHQPDEYVDCDEFVKCVKAICLFVIRWCGLA